MKKEQRKRIVDRHRDSLKRFGYHPNALYWSSREIQDVRFRVLAEVGIESGDSVLDVGCGFADFKSWIEGQGKQIDFTGVDLSPDLIMVAKEKHPDAQLFCGELTDFEFSPGTFDWVILSGALNEQLHDDGAYARRIIAMMYGLCRKGVAFNMLDARHIKAHDLQSVDPIQMFDYCKNIASDAELHDGYLANDFSIYMYR
ncbi:Methyltransferase domain-containing protein [Mariprofundus ferrinatatus]|uniref:Methyltransferase domain-containing protein n=1 Tax=Mariprofundus ferrinatatus TaxID=1921087 RepID=A0A2K8L3D2_9PROT|nr:class I SAM-dependent methyltransferase [Mariprofundus ferrinatatus]ATX81787.1 Methyltransferase domain-containing protein [Mariprofundus ferrinatatus]